VIDAKRLDDPLPRDWYIPLRLEVARLVLENMGGNWQAWRRLLPADRARLIATRRIVKMVEIAQAHEIDTRMELKRRDEGR
jgi:hypothetical protein